MEWFWNRAQRSKKCSKKENKSTKYGNKTTVQHCKHKLGVGVNADDTQHHKLLHRISSSNSTRDLISDKYVLPAEVVQFSTESDSCEIADTLYCQRRNCNDTDTIIHTREKQPLRRICSESSQMRPLLSNDRLPSLTTGKAYRKHVTYADERVTCTNNNASSTSVFNTSPPLSQNVDKYGKLNDILEEDEDQPCMKADNLCTKSPLVLKGEYYVRTQCDDKRCSITDIVELSDGRLVIADESNKNIKVISTTDDGLHYFDMPSEPWGLDRAGSKSDEAVVTFPNEKCIRTISIDRKISTVTILKTINMDSKCFGIKCTDSELFVALEKEIQILDTTGQLKAKLLGRNHRFHFTIGKPSVSGGRFLTVDVQNDEHAIFYVTDNDRHCLFGVDRNDKQVCHYKTDTDDNKTLGLSMGPNRKLLVCQSPSSLALLTFGDHGTRIRNLLELEDIQTVHFNHLDKKLWVARSNNNFIRLYSVKRDYTI